MESEAHFNSLRRALKICSYAVLVYSMVKVLAAAIAVGRAETVFADMAGGRPVPAVFGVANFIRDNFLYLLPVGLIVLWVVYVITRRSKGGVFLYVNLGLMLFLLGFASYLSSAAQQSMSTVLEGLTQ